MQRDAHRMTIPALPSGLRPEDYETIEAAVMETARGRWFLLEYARRQRAAETAQLLAAIERLEQRVDAKSATPDSPAPLLGEKLQDLAWSCRTRGLDAALCAELDALAREARGQAVEPAQIAPMRRLSAPEAAPRSPRVSDAPAPVVDPRLAALSRLDDLPFAEKIELFA